ncbi:hypothetical protein OG702_35080 [Streptomyces sp. NBC_01198]|nr:hypothetical protein OG702_35080 [Streptomyces sp. NBC_01198]
MFQPGHRRSASSGTGLINEPDGAQSRRSNLGTGIRDGAQRPVGAAQRAGGGVLACQDGAGLLGGGGPGEVAGRVAVAAVIGALSNRIRGAAVDAILGGTEKITEKDLAAVPLEYSVQQSASAIRQPAR